MRLGTSYGQIFRLSLPIMMGSGSKYHCSLTMFFLYHFDHLQFAAIGVIGAFYLVLASIGYGFFSRGGGKYLLQENMVNATCKVWELTFRHLFFLKPSYQLWFCLYTFIWL